VYEKVVKDKIEQVEQRKMQSNIVRVNENGTVRTISPLGQQLMLLTNDRLDVRLASVTGIVPGVASFDWLSQPPIVSTWCNACRLKIC